MQVKSEDEKMNPPRVVICGLGPAGAAASMYLSHFGIPHTILEKGAFPRDKICGDAISGKGLDVIGKLYRDELMQFAANTSKSTFTKGIRFVAPNARGVNIAFPPPKNDLPIGFISRRTEFDEFLSGLCRNPYANIIEGADIKQVSYSENNKVTIEYTTEKEAKALKADLVIGADGYTSRVKKGLLGEAQDDKHFCGGIRGYYKGVTGLHAENYLELIFLPELLPGYFWIFPLPNGDANVGMGMLSSHIKEKKVNLRKALLNVIANNPQIAPRFQNALPEGKLEGCGLPLGSKRRVLSGNNFILTGDAASLIDPFTGEGIGNALVSGMVAARHTKAAVENSDFSAARLSAYDKEIYAKFGKELKLSHVIQRLTKKKWLFNMVVNKINKNEALQHVFTNMFTDMELREKMKSPLFYVKLLFNINGAK